MATTFISTNAISTTLRVSAMKSRAALSEATKEATTGRLADVGLDLGALTGRDVVLRAGLNDVDKLVDTNTLVAGHLDVTQERLSTLIDTATSFQKDMLASRNSANGGNIIAQPAAANLQSLLATLNVTMDGQHLFAGINTAVQPMTDYAPGSTNKNAIDAAFSGYFGFAQNSPLVSTTETVDSSVSANEPAFRKLAMAYTMLSDIGTQNLNQAALQTVIDTATKVVGDAINDLAGIGATIGTVQEKTTIATSRLKVQADLFTKQIDAMEAVAPEEASVRVTNLQNQLEMSLALTARIQQMSILNYLPAA
jgi:flagellar hook-associated protein 3 FlgL